ncbi:MAG: MFS transporter [Candidatus Heimdallarchaeota archaeon]|nr:MAG: MFS transporter [Candidatus Heimdallarchaeota archaeon]
MANDENLEEKKVEEKGLNRIILILGILSVLFFIASAYGVQRTILSTFAEDRLEFSRWFTNWAWISIAFTIAGFGLFKAIAGLFTGVYTQRIGTKIMILLGAGCFVVGAIPLLFSDGDPLLLGIGNSILGAGEGLLYAGAMTYLSDISTAARRAQWMGVMELAVYGGYSFGAVMAGWITMITEAAEAFTFSAIVSSLGLIIAFIAVRSTVKSGTQEELEKLRTPIETKTTPKFRNLIIRPTVILTCLNGHISKMVDGIIVLFLPLMLSSTMYGYEFSIRETGLITGVFTLSWALVMPLAGNISDKIGRKVPTSLGLVVEAVAIFGLQAGDAPFLVLFILSALGGIGVGLYYPVLPSISVDIAPEDQKPKVIGFYRAIKDLGYFTGPMVACFIAQLWYNSNQERLDLVLRVPLHTAGLLLLLGAISLVIVRETRPGWAQFQTTLDHAQLVEKSVIHATKGLLVYLEQEAMETANFQERSARYSLRAKDLELQADSQLEEIVVQTYRSLYKTPDANNFLRIARRLDRVAGLTLGALFRIQTIPIEEVPPLIQEKLHDAAIALRALVRTTVDVLQVLEIKLDAVAGVYHTVRDRETDLDLLYQIMNQHLFISSREMHYGTWYAIKDVINMIEQAADSAEDAAEVINFLAIKYKT